MKCKILLKGRWKIVAVCPANKPASLFEIFINKIGSNHKVEVAKILNLLERMSVSSPNAFPREFTKPVGDGVYEIKTKNLRVFFLKEKGRVVVLCNGYVKKSTKADKNAIKKAKKLKKEYDLSVKNKKLTFEE